MQATMDQFGAVRRRMDLEDMLAMARRQKSWILGPLLAGLTISVVVAFLWMDTYLSVAAIRVVPSAVPEKFIPTNVNVQMAERVQAMQQTILSRNTLTNIIQTYNLYQRERNRLPMDDVIEQMRKDVFVGSIVPLGRSAGRMNAVAFQISYAYENRYTAQKVTRDLMTRFIDENIRERSSQSQQTTAFLRDQYAAAKQELDSLEARMTQFRMANRGSLPEALSSNMQQLSGLESRVSTLNSNISRAKQEQYMLESELRASRERLAAMLKAAAENPPVSRAAGGGGGPAQGEDELVMMDREIQKLERYLERMLEQYKPTYPDVQRLEQRLKSMRKEREEMLNKRLALPAAPAQAGETPAPPVRMSPQQSKELGELEAHVARTQSSIRAKEMEIERYLREIGDAERKSRELQQRLEVSPLGQAQFDQLNRDYDMAKKNYDDLKVKLTSSQMASEVEERKQGETLEVLDMPSLPEQPTKPNRYLFLAVGLVLGLVAGIGLAGIRELKDTSLKSMKDIRAYTQFSVLGSIPLLENDLVLRRRRRIAILGWTAALMLSAISMSSAIYYYFTTRL